jgi:hypothetical protein
VESVHVNEAAKQAVLREAGLERTGTAPTLADSGLKYCG